MDEPSPLLQQHLNCPSTSTAASIGCSSTLKAALVEPKDSVHPLVELGGQEILVSVKISPDALESVLDSTESPPPSSPSSPRHRADIVDVTVAVETCETPRDKDTRAPAVSLQIERSSSLSSPRVLFTTPTSTDVCAPMNVAQENQQQAQPQQQAWHHRQQLSQAHQQQHISYSSSSHNHRSHHHHQHYGHRNQQQYGSRSRQVDKKHKNRRFSYSKVENIPSKVYLGHRDDVQQGQDQLLSVTDPDREIILGSQARNGIEGPERNGSWGMLVDPTVKCCNVRPPPLLTVSTASEPHQRHQQQQDQQQQEHSRLFVYHEGATPPPTALSQSSEATSPIFINRLGLIEANGPSRDTDLEQQAKHLHDHEAQHMERPRVCKMLVKHPAVKLDWRVPEPIKAGGETLRGVLVISAKDLQDIGSGKKKRDKRKSDKINGQDGDDNQKGRPKLDRLVRIEHIEIDLTGVEEVVTGAGLLSRTRVEQHCFLHKTQFLPVQELKCIHGSCSSSMAAATPVSATASTASHPPVSMPSSAVPTTGNHLELPSLAPSAATESSLPGRISPGARQGITFQMRVPEKVGGTFKSTHASISYQLTATVHVRVGKEAFVLQHSLPLSLFELVQIRAATKIASPFDISPVAPLVVAAGSPPSSVKNAFARSTSCSTTSTSCVQQSSSVRFVIPKANSVLGTAAVKPYSLWGLGPATSSQRHHYTYSNSHGYGRYRHSHGQGSSHKSQSSFYATTAMLAPDNNLTPSHSLGMPSSNKVHPCSQRRMTLLHSEDGTLSSQQALSYEENGTSYRKASGFQESELLPSEDTDVQRPQQRHAFHNRQTSRNTDRTDGLDEVGFGAHIDKSVAAAGDHVSLDMFVVKSDLMKVVDIKVSLVETIQVFSLMDHDDACSVISPRASRARVFGIPGDQNEHTDQEYTSSSRRRLVDTYVCKIAKDYVPAQSEESHANGNHLKGYYEDYEDFRTAKSLSVYKIGMRIPETALTVSDRELLQVDYMFVIKFFFKGRMGAFLELPIEIVSQYNHNRISTISGAISCVSNSVQIALPPVPILVRRAESFLTDSNTTESSNTLQSKAVDPEPGSCRDGRIDGINSSCRTDSFIIQNCDEAISAARGSRTSLQKLVDSGTTANEPVMAPIGKETPLPRLSVSVASAKANIAQVSSTTVAKKTLSTTDGPSSDRVKHATSLDTGKKAPLHSWGTGSNSPKSAVEYKSSSAVAGRKEGQDIVSRSGLSKAESEACKSNVARITAALMGKELAATTSSKNSVGLKKSSTLNSAVSTNGVPKIIVNSGRSKRGTTNSTSSNSTSSNSTSSNSTSSNSTSSNSTFNTFKSNSTLTSNSTRRSSLQDKDLSSPDDQAASVIKPAPFPNSKVSLSSVTSAGTSEVASPTLPLLFDLTSAALPSSPTVNVPAPIAIPVRVSTSGNSSGNTNSVGNNGQGVGTLTSAVTSPSSAVNGFKDTGASLQQQQQQQLLYARRNRASSIQSTSASSNFSGSTDDSSSLDSSNDSRSAHNNNGLVAKIAKSLSSPLLRSRGGSASGGLTTMTSPNSSSTNLHSVSPQQQSTAFTLAATTLSALTLLSSVGQAAVASEGATCNRNMGAVGMAHSGTSHGSSQHQQYGRRLYQSSPSALQPLTSCLKKRRESAPAITVTTSLSTGLNGARKKVTFAKGTTPLSSPTASQVFFPETEYCPKTGQPYHHPFQQRQQFSNYGSSSPTPAFYSQQQGLLTPKGLNVAFTRAAAAALPAIGTSAITRTATQMVRSPKDTLPISATTVGAIMNGTQHADAELMMGGKSPSSATPRSRMYHPFDSHPSRLSPLEKQHLGFQIKTQSPMSASHTGLDSDQEQGRSVRRGTDVEDEDDEEDDEDDDEDIEYEDEDDSEDDDERETDEQRIERRRQARAAWLAKYGDAFKQVYGAVPELPPI